MSSRTQFLYIFQFAQPLSMGSCPRGHSMATATPGIISTIPTSRDGWKKVVLPYTSFWGLRNPSQKTLPPPTLINQICTKYLHRSQSLMREIVLPFVTLSDQAVSWGVVSDSNSQREMPIRWESRQRPGNHGIWWDWRNRSPSCFEIVQTIEQFEAGSGHEKDIYSFFFFNFFLAELDLCCRTQTLSSCGGQRPLPRFGAPALLLADHGL